MLDDEVQKFEVVGNSVRTANHLARNLAEFENI